MDFSKAVDGVNEVSSGLGAASSIMGMAKNIGQLNAQGKFKRHMHERAIETLENKKKMAELDGVSQTFQFNRGMKAKERSAYGDLRGNDVSLRSLASNINALGSQV